jgi:hypothetical protein
MNSITLSFPLTHAPDDHQRHDGCGVCVRPHCFSPLDQPYSRISHWTLDERALVFPLAPNYVLECIWRQTQRFAAIAWLCLQLWSLVKVEIPWNWGANFTKQMCFKTLKPVTGEKIVRLLFGSISSVQPTLIDFSRGSVVVHVPLPVSSNRQYRSGEHVLICL